MTVVLTAVAFSGEDLVVPFSSHKEWSKGTDSSWTRILLETENALSRKGNKFLLSCSFRSPRESKRPAGRVVSITGPHKAFSRLETCIPLSHIYLRILWLRVKPRTAHFASLLPFWERRICENRISTGPWRLKKTVTLPTYFWSCFSHGRLRMLPLRAGFFRLSFLMMSQNFVIGHPVGSFLMRFDLRKYPWDVFLLNLDFLRYARDTFPLNHDLR